MKERLTRNIGLKILSIILASLLWVAITNIDNPVSSENFKDISVEIINDDIIANSEEVYDVLQGETIDFTVEARRSIIDQLTINDFKVVADFSLISSFDTIQIEISSPKYGDDIKIVDGKYQMMKISREESMEAKFKVDILTIGEPAIGYHIGEKVASPNIVSVIGPKARVETVDKVIVEVNVGGAFESFSQLATTKMVDENGNEIEDLKLTLSDDEVNANIKLLEKKVINLIISSTGDLDPGYIMTSLEYQPKTIVVAGEGEEFDALRYLAISENITGATENIEKEINLQDYLPEGIILVEDEIAVININIERETSRSVGIFSRDIKVNGNTKDFKVSYIDKNVINMTFKGLKDDIEKILSKEDSLYIDVYDLEEGIHELDINLGVGSKVTIENQSKVKVELKR